MTTPLGTATGQIRIEAAQALAALAAVRRQSANTVGTMNTLGRTAIMAGGALAAIGGAAAYGLYRAARIAAEFEFKMDFLYATVKANTKQMEDLRDAALQFGSTSGFGPREVADAFVELGKAGVDAEDIVRGVGRAVITLGQSADIALSDAASIIVSTQATFQRLASQAQETADIIQGAANASLIDVADFGVTMKYVGNVAAASGIELEDLSTAIALVGNQGIRGSTAGTSLRRMLLQLTPRTDKARAAMEELGIITEDGTNRFYDQAGSAKSLRDVFEILRQSTAKLTDARKKDALAAIFGDRAIATALATAKGGEEAYDRVNEQLNESTAAEIAAKRFDNLEGSIRKFKGALEAARISAGSQIQSPLRTLVDTLTKAAIAWTSLDESTRNWLIRGTLTVSGILLVVGALIMFVGIATRAVAAVVQLSKAYTRLQQTAFGARLAVVSFRTAMLGLSVGGVVLATAVYWFVKVRAAAAEAAAQANELTENLNYTDTDAVEEAYKQLEKLRAKSDAVVRETNLLSNIWNVASMNFLAAAKASDELSSAMAGVRMRGDAATVTASKIARAMGITTTQVEKLAVKAGIDLSEGVEAVTDRFAEYYVQATQGTNRSEDLAAAIGVLGDEAATTEESVKALKDSLSAAMDPTLDAEEAADRYSEALRKIAQAAKENGRNIRGTGEKAEANRDAFRDLARQGQEWITTAAAMGASEQDVAKLQQQLRTDLIKARMALGDTKTAAEEYVESLGLIPAQKPTRAVFENRDAKAEIERYKALLKSIPPDLETLLLVTPLGVDRNGKPVKPPSQPKGAGDDPLSTIIPNTRAPQTRDPGVRGVAASLRTTADPSIRRSGAAGGGTTVIDNSKTTTVNAPMTVQERTDPNAFGSMVAFRVRGS